MFHGTEDLQAAKCSIKTVRPEWQTEWIPIASLLEAIYRKATSLNSRRTPLAKALSTLHRTGDGFGAIVFPGITTQPVNGRVVTLAPSVGLPF